MEPNSPQGGRGYGIPCCAFLWFEKVKLWALGCLPGLLYVCMNVCPLHLRLEISKFCICLLRVNGDSDPLPTHIPSVPPGDFFKAETLFIKCRGF